MKISSSKMKKSSHYIVREKNGFTLAEVLIVLGIIGVVAAITIPTLIGEYIESETEIKVKRFYSMMTQAIKLSELDNGPVDTWDYGESDSLNHRNLAIMTNWYNTYLEPYIKVAAEKSTDNTNDDVLMIYLSDGSALRIVALTGNSAILGFYTKASLSFNETDPELSKAQNGKNYFAFFLNCNAFKNNLGAISEDNYNKTLEETIGKCAATIKKYANAVNCTRVLMMNNWKFPDDYPRKF